MERRADIKDAPSLLVTTLKQFTRLMQDEMALAKAEVSRNVSRAGVGLALIGVGAILALTALNVLATALVAWLAETELSAGTAALIVGVGLLAIAVIVALVGKSRLSAKALAPSKTSANVRSDIRTMKEATNA